MYNLKVMITLHCRTVINLVKDPTVLMAYIPSYMNIAPYIVGTFSGYMLFKFKRAKITLSKVSCITKNININSHVLI